MSPGFTLLLAYLIYILQYNPAWELEEYKSQ